MRTLLCRFRPPNQPQHPDDAPRTRGQVIVIFAVTLLAMLFFTGLAIDAGSLYITYGQLRRAIDAAAVAAANDFKQEGPGIIIPPITRMKAASMEVMKLHNLDETTMDLNLYVCDSDGDNVRDASLQTDQPSFYNQCPDTGAGEDPRKLVWIDARQEAPLYFLFLLGFKSVPLRAQAIAEAAPIDLVIVIDTSESMASETAGYGTGAFDPSTCNAADTCEPLHSAKVAAKALIDTLYDTYDHVGIVHYDVTAKTLGMQTTLTNAKNAVDAIKVHDDPPFTQIRPTWFYIHKTTNPSVAIQGFNAVYPEDRIGNGLDNDGGDCTMTTTTEIDNRWDDGNNLYNLTENGMPCDDPAKFDAYDWDADGKYTDADDTLAKAWITSKSPGCDINTMSGCEPIWTYFSVNSTCTGCGIRRGAQLLKDNGRPNSVWVMVFLSDGLVNLSDTPETNDDITSSFPLGYCTGGIGSYNWANTCKDVLKDNNQTIQVDINGDGDYNDTGETYKDFGSTRHCIDSNPASCPPGSISALGDTTQYTVYDYALDQIDYAGLQNSANKNETASASSDIAMYSIGLGDADITPDGVDTSGNAVTAGPIGEYLLRYMAKIGDDGDRSTDECFDAITGVQVAPQTNCGQYYYAPSGSGLRAIFNEISTRIYSRLTK